MAFAPASATTTTPHILNYQARITDASGTPVPDGTLHIKISIYSDQSSTSTCLYTMRGTCGAPANYSATSTNGVFSVLIGDSTQNQIPDSLFDGSTRYLGITIESDNEMTPRKQISNAAFAFNAEHLDSLDTSNAGGTNAFVPVTDANGNLTITGTPQGTGVTQGSFTVNAVSTSASNVVFGVSVAGSGKLQVTQAGDATVNGSLTLNDPNVSPTGNIFKISNSIDSTRYLTVSSTSTLIDPANVSGYKLGLNTTSPTEALTVNGNGFVSGHMILGNNWTLGSSTADANTPIYVNETLTGSLPIGIRSDLTFNPTLASSSILGGFERATIASNNATSVTDVGGFQAQGKNSGTGTVSDLVGVVGDCVQGGSNIVSNCFGQWAREFLTGSGTTTNAIGYFTRNFMSGSGSAINNFDLFAGAPSVSGTGSIANLYGLYIEAMTAGTSSNFAIDYNNGSNGFYVTGSGNVGIGQSTPTAYLHLKAGTASASTAPIKFTSGTLLTTPENGALEYDGTNLYITNSGTRQQLAYSSGSGALDLQQAYNNTTGAVEIGLNSTQGALTLADNGTGIGANLFEIQNSNDSKKYLTVSSTSTLLTQTGYKLGIGTSSPVSVFSIVDGAFNLNAGSTKGLQVMTSDTVAWTNLGTDASNTPILDLSSPSALLVDKFNTTSTLFNPTGITGYKVGIGTASPTETFNIIDGAFILNAGATKGLQVITTDTTAWTNLGTTASLPILDLNDSSNVVQMRVTGTNLTVGSASDTYTITPNARVAGNWTPSADDTYTLGDYDRRWKSLFVGPGSVVVANDTTQTNYEKLTFTGSTAQLYADGATPIQIANGGNAGYYLNTSGLAGVNTTTPTANLTVLGSGYISGHMIMGNFFTPGVSQSNSNRVLDIIETQTGVTGVTPRALNVLGFLSPTASGQSADGLLLQEATTATNTTTVENLASLELITTNQGFGNVNTAMYGGLFKTNNASGGNVTDDFGVFSQLFSSGTGTITNAAGVRVSSPTVTAGSITNLYGVYVKPQLLGTSLNYAYFYTDGSDSFGVSGAGNVGIGLNAMASARLVVRDGNIVPTGNILEVENTTNSEQYLTVSSTATTVTNLTITGTCTGCSNSSNLQTAYNNATSTTEITLNGTQGALTLADTLGGTGGNLLEIQNNSGSTKYFTVAASAVTSNVDLIANTRVLTQQVLYQGGSSLNLTADVQTQALPSVSITNNSNFSATATTAIGQGLLKMSGTFGPSSGSTPFAPLQIFPTINQTGSANGNYIGILENVTETRAQGVGNKLIDLQIGGNSRFVVNSSGLLTIAASDTSPTYDLLDVQNFNNSAKYFTVSSTATTVGGDLLPTADNTYSLGSPTLRWKTLNVGPGSVVVHNDTSNTQKLTLDFSGANAARISSDSSSSLQLTTDANTGMLIDTSGRVGVGSTDPFTDGVTGFTRLVVADDGNGGISGPRADIAQRAIGNDFATHEFISTGGTLASPSASLNGDTLGKIRFNGAADCGAGCQFRVGAAIEAAIDGVPSFGILPGRLLFSTQSTTGALVERMRIDTSGNVLIGNTTGTARLVVQDGSISPTTNIFQVANLNDSSRYFTVSSTSTLINPSTVSGYKLGIGTNSPIEQLHVPGAVPTAATGSVTTDAGPGSIYVQGRYAYLANGSGNSLQIIDVSNPSSPISVGHAAITAPNSVYVQGRYAYVVNSTSNTLQIFDVSNPAMPVPTGAVGTGSLPDQIYVQGRYAYVGSLNAHTLQIFDVSRPTSPIALGSVSTGLGSLSLYVQGRYAYVTSYTSNLLQIYDVSNPSAPALVGSMATGSHPAYQIYVQGRYAYFTDNGADQLEIADVSNPTAPFSVNTVSTNAAPQAVYVQGRYAYVASAAPASLQVFDVSNPSSIVSIGSVAASSNPLSIFVQGRYAYVPNDGSGLLQIFDVGGAYIQQLEAGGVETGTVSVRNNLSALDGSFRGGLDVGASLNVSGDLSASGTAQVSRLTIRNDFSPTSNILQIENSTNSQQYLTVSSTSVGIVFPAGSATFALCHATNGAATTAQTIEDCVGSVSADYAENYPIADSATTSDIVALGTDSAITTQGAVIRKLVKSSSAYQPDMVGVVSDPSMAGDFNSIGYNIVQSDHPMPVALKGRVMLHVTDENGPIKAGDRITSSSTAGYGMKATKPGMIVGYALDDFNGVSGSVMVFVNPGFDADSAIGTDGTYSFLNDDFKLNAKGTATSNTPDFNSDVLSFRGSAWDSASNTAVSRDISVLNETTDPSNYQLAFRNNDGNLLATLNQKGDLSIAGSLSVDGGFDYAETFPAVSEFDAGDLVAPDDSATSTVGVKKSSSAYQNDLLGIVSTKPGFLSGDAKDGAPVAMAGRVPTKVSTENGLIHIGDPITSSSAPGVGMKATEPGRVVGIALQNYDSSGIGLITVFVNPAWYNGPAPASGQTSAGSGLTVQQDSVMDFKNSMLTDVASLLSTNGLWSVTSDGYLVAQHIQANDVHAQKYAVDNSGADRSAGTGVMPAGHDGVLIQNPLVQPNSLIVVSFEGNPGSSWWIGEKQAGSFMLTLAAPAPGDVPFTYWLVGVDDGATNSASSTSPTGSSTDTPPAAPPPAIPPPTAPPPAIPPPTDTTGSASDTTQSASSTSP